MTEGSALERHEVPPDSTTASPLRLLQERVGGDPWRVLVVCVLLNKTPGRRAEPVLWRLLAEYPSAAEMARADVTRLEEILKPLGLSKRRARALVDLSRAYAEGRWSRPLDLPGVGPYACDSYEIFVKGNLAVQPTDVMLRRYLEWRREGQPSGPASEQASQPPTAPAPEP